MNKDQCRSSSDRIGELPTSIVQTILMRLPLRDMVRTSILSRNWRFQWVTVPQLVFDLDVFQPRNASDEVNMNIVFGILLLHEGPILKFKLDMPLIGSRSPAVHKIIPLLSRNGIQDLTLDMKFGTIPSSIFKCLELKHLCLTDCQFRPLKLIGFHNLISIELNGVILDSDITIPCGPSLERMKLYSRTGIRTFSLDAPSLKILHVNATICSIGSMNTPLVKVLSLQRISDPSMVMRHFPFVESLLIFLPYDYQKAVRDFPTGLKKLKVLILHIQRTKDMDEISSTLMWIRSLPHLEKLKFTIKCRRESEPNFQMLEHSVYYLKKLQEVEFEFLNDMKKPCMEFIKFILAISPKLEKLYIKPFEYGNDVNWYKSLLGLTCSRRASAKVDIVFLGLN